MNVEDDCDYLVDKELYTCSEALLIFDPTCCDLSFQQTGTPWRRRDSTGFSVAIKLS